MDEIFISHATDDRKIADALKGLVHDVFGKELLAVKYSSDQTPGEGIDPGMNWLSWIEERISAARVALVILTPKSVTRPWLMWEAGAASGVALGKGSDLPVIPLLFGEVQIPSPLRSVQAKRGDQREGILSVLEALRQRTSVGKHHFELGVGKGLDPYLRSLVQGDSASHDSAYDVYVAAPMTSVDTDKYVHERAVILRGMEKLRAKGHSVYFSGERFPTPDDFDDVGVGTEDDLSVLKTSRNFLMIYPEPVVSSCLVEAGYALVAGKPSSYFVTDAEHLPFQLKGVTEADPNVKLFRYKDDDDLIARMDRYAHHIVRAS